MRDTTLPDDIDSLRSIQTRGNVAGAFGTVWSFRMPELAVVAPERAETFPSHDDG